MLLPPVPRPLAADMAYCIQLSSRQAQFCAAYRILLYFSYNNIGSAPHNDTPNKEPRMAAAPTTTRSLGDSALAARLRRELEGDVLFDAFSRGRYSTDASHYQIEPIGVVVPKTAQDIHRVIQIATEEGRARPAARRRHLAMRPDGRRGAGRRRQQAFQPDRRPGSRGAPGHGRTRRSPRPAQPGAGAAWADVSGRRLDIQPGDDRRHDRQQQLRRAVHRARHHVRQRRRDRRDPGRRHGDAFRAAAARPRSPWTTKRPG